MISMARVTSALSGEAVRKHINQQVVARTEAQTIVCAEYLNSGVGEHYENADRGEPTGPQLACSDGRVLVGGLEPQSIWIAVLECVLV